MLSRAWLMSLTVSRSLFLALCFALWERLLLPIRNLKHAFRTAICQRCVGAETAVVCMQVRLAC
jgi:hypothetical protein